jgi:type III pantothenate kinase
LSTSLQLDIGNSGAKWRCVQAGQVLARGRFLPSDQESLNHFYESAPEPDAILISSVAGRAAEADLIALLARRWQVEPWFARSQEQTGGLVNSYSDPSRMGVDRWLAMLGAWRRAGERLCVVDAGSALTIDLVDAGGHHEGGYIIPGPHLMERALLLDTDRVRFDENVPYQLCPGVSTAEAVRHGVALAQVGALALALDRAGAAPRLFVCGGGGEQLMRLLDRDGELVADLVFEGLETMAALHDPPG